MTRSLPPRRLLAVAAALALLGGPADALGTPAVAPSQSALNKTAPTCPLGSGPCAPRPADYAMCRPNAMLSFYDPALADPTLGHDRRLRDSSNTLVSAQHVDSSDRSVYRLSGAAQLQRADQRLDADRIDYHDDSTDYDASGHVHYQDAGQLFAASRVRGNTTASTGRADDVRYQMLAARGNGAASRAQMFDADRTRYTDASYSTCDVGHHVWEFRAASISVDQASGRGVAKDASFRVGGVPLFYLPWVSFPVDDRRMSGFLYPTIGHTSRAGYFSSTPFYLNLAPNLDATLDPRYYSLRGPLLDGELRYLLPGTSGSLAAQFLPRDHGAADPGTSTDTSGTRRYYLVFDNRTQFAEHWNYTAHIARSSDNTFLYDFGNQLGGAPVDVLGSTAQISGSGHWWDASIGGSNYQNMNPFLGDSSLPYRQLPYARFDLDAPLNSWLAAGVQSHYADFRKPGFVAGSRLDVQPFVAADFGAPGWFLRPRLAWRYTGYQLGGDYARYGYYGLLGSGLASPFTQRSPSRSLPVASLDSGLIFERDLQLFGTHYTQTLEPRLYYLYVPYRQQDQLPLFDTSMMSFDYAQLFGTNPFAGADRQMNANNLTAALTSRLLDDNGVERLAASFGQIRYFSPQRVQLPVAANTSAPATDWSGSAYVAQLDLRVSDRWLLSSAYQWDPNTHQSALGMFRLQGRLGADGVLNFAYRYRRGLLEQYSASAVYPLSMRWRLIGAWTYAEPVKGLVDSPRGTVEALAGVEYDSCCVALRLVGRHYVNQRYYGVAPPTTPGQTSLRDNAVMFEVVFKGLGATGGQIDPLLRRDILGYQ